jgi:hypothetical protein
MAKTKKLYTVSITVSVADAAKAKAKDEMRSFSAHVENLIRKDLGK